STTFENESARILLSRAGDAIKASASLRPIASPSNEKVWTKARSLAAQRSRASAFQKASKSTSRSTFITSLLASFVKIHSSAARFKMKEREVIVPQAEC